MTSKARRHYLIEELLASHSVRSQQQLRDLMAERGIDLSVVTVSRDLEEIGAVKLRSGGEPLYALPEIEAQRSVPTDMVAKVCASWVVDASHSANLVVLRTPPGSAHVVASAIDRSALSGVLGTVAGDDTLLVVADEATGGEALAAVFKQMADL